MKIKIASTGQTALVESDLEIKPGQEVLIQIDNIVESAVVLCGKDCPKPQSPEEKQIIVLRMMSPQDLIEKKKLKEKAESYLDEAKAKVFRHGLSMKILDAELSFDQKKLTFFFSAEGRVDFRALVADMMGNFNKIIRLQQVGARDEAKHFGGYGKCGRPLCCATFLNNLESVTLDMAESQDVNTKSAKSAGCCGKLMCCLSYEAGNPKMPKIEKTNVQGKNAGGKS